MPDDEPRADGGTASDEAAPPDDPADVGLDDEPEPAEPGVLKSDDPAEAEPEGENEDAGLKRADPSDAFVPRDETGEVSEVETTVEGYGTAVVKPMVYGQVEKYLGDAGSVASAGPATIATLMREHVLEPDFEAFAKENFREFAKKRARANDESVPPFFNEHVVAEQMSPFAPQAYLLAIMRESGMDVNVMMGDDGSATIEFGDDEGN